MVWFTPIDAKLISQLAISIVEHTLKNTLQLPQFDTNISRMLTYSQDFITFGLGFMGK
jgi:hypothetical protein